MSFAIDDAHLPAILTAQPMTDEEFMAFCNEHPDLFFEMTAEGELIVMAPTHSEGSARNNSISQQLGSWAEQDGRGIVSDSSGGFVLPNGARRSPDASWTLQSRVEQLPEAARKGFWHLCPDFVIELRSDSDRLEPLRKKMLEYIANGAQLGWLIDPITQAVTIYGPDSEPEIHTNVDAITSEGPMATLTLRLGKIWDPLGK